MSHAGLVPVVALTQRAGLGALVVEHVGPGGPVRRAHASGSFPPNAAWLTCAAIAHDLLRAAGSLASLGYAKARGARNCGLTGPDLVAAARSTPAGHPGPTPAQPAAQTAAGCRPAPM